MVLFVVDAYPVSVHAWDVVLIFITVLAVGFLSVWYPVRYLSKRLFINQYLGLSKVPMLSDC